MRGLHRRARLILFNVAAAAALAEAAALVIAHDATPKNSRLPEPAKRRQNGRQPEPGDGGGGSLNLSIS